MTRFTSSLTRLFSQAVRTVDDWTLFHLNPSLPGYRKGRIHAATTVMGDTPSSGESTAGRVDH
jgi:hypothetical protein